MAASNFPFILDTSRFEFEVVKTAEPKYDNEGVQKRDFVTKVPVWAVEVTAYAGENEGATQMVVSVASETRPELKWRQPVEIVDLELIPWANKKRNGDLSSGVAFKATEVRPISVSQTLKAA